MEHHHAVPRASVYAQASVYALVGECFEAIVYIPSINQPISLNPAPRAICGLLCRIVETLTQLGSKGGQLGASTIVGSAAYNVSMY